MATSCPETTPEVRGLRAVECPAFWPASQGSPLVAAQYYDDSGNPERHSCVESSNEGKTYIRDVAGPTELWCDYTDAQLSISVPGGPAECRALVRKQPLTGQLRYRIACYFKPSGDAGKDKVTIDEIQELTRDTEIFGLRLSITCAELELALSAKGARVISSDEKAIHANLGNGKEAVAIFTTQGQTREIDIDASNLDDNLYPMLKHRFGSPQQIDEPGKSPWSTFWDGEPNVRLEIDSLERIPTFTRRLRLIDIDKPK
ncbi:MAG: hypothetical protein ACRD2O_16365 [Terriglobia bacterium]